MSRLGGSEEEEEEEEEAVIKFEAREERSDVKKGSAGFFVYFESRGGGTVESEGRLLVSGSLSCEGVGLKNISWRVLPEQSAAGCPLS